MTRYHLVTLAADIMYINRIPFFATVSRHLHFCTAEALANQQPGTLLCAFRNVQQAYASRGFTIQTVLLDGQFEHLCGVLSAQNLLVNTTSHDEHVPNIELHIRTLKERRLYHTLPFRSFPD
jgi:hypothetical protein